MNTFPGWRAVGRAMRWARQQDGIGYATRERSFGRHHVWGWRANGQTIEIRITWGISTELHGRGPIRFMFEELTATQALRVLAALDLLPAELAAERTDVASANARLLIAHQARDEAS